MPGESAAAEPSPWPTRDGDAGRLGLGLIAALRDGGVTEVADPGGQIGLVILAALAAAVLPARAAARTELGRLRAG